MNMTQETKELHTWRWIAGKPLAFDGTIAGDQTDIHIYIHYNVSL